MDDEEDEVNPNELTFDEELEREEYEERNRDDGRD